MELGIIEKIEVVNRPNENAITMFFVNDDLNERKIERSSMMFSKNDDITKLENEIIKKGDHIFYKLIEGARYKVITLNALKTQYSEFLEVAENLTGEESLQINIDPGTATSDQIAEYLIELKKLYMMMGGSGIVYNPNNVKVLINSY
ncbi:hypothetical protein [Flavivirga eckloniae]|uniref:Uncharacterized protein n=1 Tax=Flavivirga eckloniae TaxID=1803846 RepID=A0A2K9PWI0_9FLAO|nr:hypothetical protein [Flavivirga eckloniae]AUP81419.1 hypothetical protein C1H87_22950 [Flavivirga eckloniae]